VRIICEYEFVGHTLFIVKCVKGGAPGIFDVSACKKKILFKGSCCVTPPSRQKNNIIVAPDRNNNASSASGDDSGHQIDSS